MINYSWQNKFLNEPNNYALLCAEVGCGKSHVAGEWVKQNGRNDRPVIFCPKQIVGDWQKRTPGASVFTPQTILKSPLPSLPSAIIVDEADAFASPLFVPQKRSKCADALYNYIRSNPQAHVLLLTATPVRSTPWNLHTLLCYIKRYTDFKDWRNKYFYLDQPRYMSRPGYFPRPGWQKQMQEVIDSNATVALMKDMVDELPPETNETIKIKPPTYEKNEEWEAAKQFVEDHLLEQAGKLAEIKKISRGYRKVVVVAHYREQIEQLHKNLSSERETFVLDGRTTNVADVIANAEASDECFFIIQSSIGAGFEIPSFSCMVFASQGYSARNYTQMRGRIRRINALKPVIYYHLLGGKCDKMIKDSIDAGKDFIPSFYREYQQ